MNADQRARPVKVYADTSVFGGCFDSEFATSSREFFAELVRGRFQLVTSAVVRDEISSAPAVVRNFFNTRTHNAEIAAVTAEALALQRAYLAAGVLTEKWLADALHVALASVSGCELIVSWNFKHIVHFQKIPRYNEINKLHGYSALGIYSPQQVIEYEDEKI